MLRWRTPDGAPPGLGGAANGLHDGCRRSIITRGNVLQSGLIRPHLDKPATRARRLSDGDWVANALTHGLLRATDCWERSQKAEQLRVFTQESRAASICVKIQIKGITVGFITDQKENSINFVGNLTSQMECFPNPFAVFYTSLEWRENVWE